MQAGWKLVRAVEHLKFLAHGQQVEPGDMAKGWAHRHGQQGCHRHGSALHFPLDSAKKTVQTSFVLKGTMQGMQFVT